uniref:Stimulator of interferon genes protein n=1 Tax=Odontella aurita TaxID=265563 RepID=A0A7S4J6Y0_9STRA|mmetsp:Transcript_40078/g.120815  ORF Transcript_40078/g.120815 Transcript_40078/m.120815 type:complete len:258 (+) Transcript_40078:1306-2079(+)
MVFLSAGMVPFVNDLLAAAVRHRGGFVRRPLHFVDLRLALLYVAFIATGVGCIVGDSRGLSCSDKGNWAEAFGIALFEAGLVYPASRLFLFTENPADEVRSLRAENKKLQDNESAGISEGYFLNFARFVAYDLIHNRIPESETDPYLRAEKGMVPLRCKSDDGVVFKDVPYLVILVPHLEAKDFENPQGNPFYRIIHKLLNEASRKDKVSIVNRNEALVDYLSSPDAPNGASAAGRHRSQVVDLFEVTREDNSTGEQ